jgi:hypothetical protein
MQNCLPYFRSKILEMVGGPNKCAPNFFFHLENSLIYHFFELLEMLLQLSSMDYGDFNLFLVKRKGRACMSDCE